MAQLAIPLLALGGFYIIANHEKEKEKNGSCNKEGYENAKSSKERDENYPHSVEVPKSNVQKYSNANQTTDKFFDARVHSKIAANPNGSVGSGRKAQMSLTGKQIDAANFEHNNMVPFFGSKPKGATSSADVAESRLDHMQGNGSQFIQKKEQAPLFKPETNLQHAHGAPNMSEFLQSRVNPSMRMANTKPWEEERVAPGIGKGFTNDGGIGFNNGMESRETWQPKTVDELRTANNQKVSFSLSGHQGPANSMVKEIGNTKTQGRVEKYAPDTFYSLGPERWNTTTGLEKAPTARGIELLNNVSRPDTTEEYYGSGAVQDGNASYAKGEYQETHRSVLPCNPITNVNAQGTHQASLNDYGRNEYKPLPNNRATTKQSPDFGGVQGVARAVIAPIMDIIRPSRKENVVGNLRVNGTAGTSVSNVRVYNPGDRTKTTIREMTEGAADGKYLNIQQQNADAYPIIKPQPTNVQRDTTTVAYVGNAETGSKYANQTYNAAYRQRNNINKSYESRPNQGGTQIFNQTDNITINRIDSDRNNKRTYAPTSAPYTITSKDTYGEITGPQYNNQKIDDERINPDLLSAFKKNPYTQSLQSVA